MHVTSDLVTVGNFTTLTNKFPNIKSDPIPIRQREATDSSGSVKTQMHSTTYSYHLREVASKEEYLLNECKQNAHLAKRIKKKHEHIMGAREIAQKLRTLSALTKDLGSVPCNQTAAHSHL